MLLALKLFLTPLFIGAATLAGRRWGALVSGVLVGLPLTSAPVSFILLTEHGRAFAAQAAVGNVAGQAAGCLFCVAYFWAAQRRWPWPVCAALAVGVFLAATFLWSRLPLNLSLAVGLLLATMGVAARAIPSYPPTVTASRPPAWDLPARMVVATTFVLVLTTAANTLGPVLSGLLSPFPVFGLVLTVFAHHQQGVPGAANVLRGLALGSAAYGSFFLIVGLGLLPLGAGIYIFATGAALGMSALAYWVAR